MFAAENGLKGDPRLQGISQAIRVVPHFPKPGLSLFFFHDFCTVFDWDGQGMGRVLCFGWF